MNDTPRDLTAIEGPVLLCRARTRLCAFPLAHVEETMRPLPLLALAGSPPFVLGMSRIRGTAVPVLDLGALLGGEKPAATSRLLTVKAGERRVALAVEEVHGLRDVPPGTMRELPPLLEGASDGAAAAVGALDGELLLVLRAARLVPEAVWAALAVAGSR